MGWHETGARAAGAEDGETEGEEAGGEDDGETETGGEDDGAVLDTTGEALAAEELASGEGEGGVLPPQAASASEKMMVLATASRHPGLRTAAVSTRA